MTVNTVSEVLFYLQFANRVRITTMSGNTVSEVLLQVEVGKPISRPFKSLSILLVSQVFPYNREAAVKNNKKIIT